MPEQAAIIDLGPTEAFISYLELLIDEKVLGPSELAAFAGRLSDGSVVNPISLTAGLQSGKWIHAQALEAFLPQGNFDVPTLQKWIEQRLAKEARLQRAREATNLETRYVPMELHRVSPRLELMTTDVTQYMWIERMGANPSRYVEGPYAQTIVVNGREYRAQPDHPVENITWWSALVFANRESEARGLKPAYDLSGIRWNPKTHAEDGTLSPISEDEGHENVRYASESRKLEDTEGYRLPSLAEWNDLAGRYLKDLPGGIGEYGIFYREGTLAEIQPVGSAARHVVIEGHEFYDLVGNVWKLLSDWTIIGSGMPPDFYVQMVGGSFKQSHVGVGALGSSTSSGFAQMKNRGLRLVRSLHSAGPEGQRP